MALLDMMFLFDEENDGNTALVSPVKQTESVPFAPAYQPMTGPGARPADQPARRFGGGKLAGGVITAALIVGGGTFAYLNSRHDRSAAAPAIMPVAINENDDRGEPPVNTGAILGAETSSPAVAPVPLPANRPSSAVGGSGTVITAITRRLAQTDIIAEKPKPASEHADTVATGPVTTPPIAQPPETVPSPSPPVTTTNPPAAPTPNPTVTTTPPAGSGTPSPTPGSTAGAGTPKPPTGTPPAPKPNPTPAPAPTTGQPKPVPAPGPSGGTGTTPGQSTGQPGSSAGQTPAVKPKTIAVTYSGTSFSAVSQNMLTGDSLIITNTSAVPITLLCASPAAQSCPSITLAIGKSWSLTPSLAGSYGISTATGAKLTLIVSKR